MTRRYHDPGVYLTARRGVSLKAKARSVLANPSQILLSSAVVRSETMPKAMFHKNGEEIAYLEYAFSKVAEWVSIDDALIQEAIDLSVRCEVVNLDALHVAAEIRVGAEEFVTTERSGKPPFRVAELKVMSLLDL